MRPERDGDGPASFDISFRGFRRPHSHAFTRKYNVQCAVSYHQFELDTGYHGDGDARNRRDCKYKCYHSIKKNGEAKVVEIESEVPQSKLQKKEKR